MDEIGSDVRVGRVRGDRYDRCTKILASVDRYHTDSHRKILHVTGRSMILVGQQYARMSSDPIPLQVSGYYVLPLSLPPLPSFPTAATHYLYLANHQPKIPSPTSPRSLFLINVPFDATDTLVKHLLSTELGLPNGRIENVHFEEQTKQDHTESAVPHTNGSTKSKKRKRSVGEVKPEDMEGINLPSTWDRDLHGIGRTAVVTFVDRASMEASIKAVKKARKDGIQPVWGKGLEDTLPALGFDRKFCILLWISIGNADPPKGI